MLISYVAECAKKSLTVTSEKVSNSWDHPLQAIVLIDFFAALRIKPMP